MLATAHSNSKIKRTGKIVAVLVVLVATARLFAGERVSRRERLQNAVEEVLVVVLRLGEVRDDLALSALLAASLLLLLRLLALLLGNRGLLAVLDVRLRLLYAKV